MKCLPIQATTSKRGQDKREFIADRREAVADTRDAVAEERARLRITPDDAFDMLRRASQSLNLKLREVAQRLADTGQLGKRRLT